MFALMKSIILLRQGFVNTNIRGGDPSVVKIGAANYMTIFVGEPYIT